MKMRYSLLLLSLFSSLSFAQSAVCVYKGCPTTAPAPAPTELSKSIYLNPVNATSAWDRGLTGKGSRILIIDTGINTLSPEFAGRIVGTKSYMSTDINDRVGHGSNVASIAAGARNDFGAVGVAYEADLLIAKVTDNTSYSMQKALQAIQWGGSQGAIVANISANTQYNATQYTKYSVQVSPGIWTNTSTVYGGSKYYNLEKPTDWANALSGTNMVLVVSAGNQGLAYPSNPATFATATDATGNLILGGRMIVVGNWNSATNTMLSSSNLAGHMCKNLSGTTCLDKYRTSDFYIIAPGVSNPGVGITTATATNTMTGTSQAAPVVTGAVAIINQLWPKMTPENIVKLLLVTANKNIPNYNVNVMGQGLLDLEKATRPVGVVGIPTTGRTTGAKVTLTGALATSGSASLSKISNVMVTDEFERDFYVAGSSLTVRPHQEFNIHQTAIAYSSKNNFALFNNYTDYHSFNLGSTDMRVFTDANKNSMFELGYTKQLDYADLRTSIGAFTENDAWLGNRVSGAIGTSTHSYTTFVGVDLSKNLDSQTRTFAGFKYGVTNTNLQNGLINNIGAIQSYTWNIGAEHTINKNHLVGAILSQPVTVSRGIASATVPVAQDSEGVVQYANQRFNIAPDVKELRTGVYYKFNHKTANLLGFVEYRNNYMGQAGITDTVVGLTLDQKF